MYASVKSCVRGCAGNSEIFDCVVGLRQGESLSPFLFAIFLNDLEEVLRSSPMNGVDIDMMKLYVLLFADDTVLISDSPEGLQNGFNSLYDYCEHWSMTVNSEKNGSCSV